MLLGVGEAAGYPAGGRIIREWAPVSERGRAAAWLNGGAYAGLAVGAIIVGWIVTVIGWRESFFITGGAGIVLAAVWYLLYRKPEQAPWISDGERRLLADEALADRAESTTDVVGPKAALSILLQSKTMWGLMLAQGCAGYTLYLFMTWLPSYLVSARGLDVLKSSLFTAIPFGAAVVLGILLGRVSDSYLHRTGVAAGGRRKIIAICMLASSVILLTPVMPETWEILVLFSISATAIATAMAMNIAITNDLLVNGALAGTAVSFLIFGGNLFGIFAPIITGYIIAVTASYTSAFLLAGALLLAGAVIVLTLTRHPIGTPATPVNHKPALL
jgi:ACS family glucarate transporter-like MFS transporter